jgi:hypothetical protein
MNKKFLVSAGVVVSMGLAGLVAWTPAPAKGFGDFMNPGKWFGGDRDHDRDYYYGRGYGYGPYGYPGYGYGYPGYGYGYPGYGYGYPGYGYGAPGYGYPAQQPAAGGTQAPAPTPQ